MNVKLIIAAHKMTQVPSNPIYFPVHVGAEGKEQFGFTPDNDGENISAKNPYYCELTGMYWAWKNLDCDVIGLVHYRRYFGKRNKDDFYAGVIDQATVEELIDKYDVILAKPRNYYIESIKTHFYNHIKVFSKVDYIDYLEKTIQELAPEYMSAYKKVFSGTKAHMCNMFIMKKSDFDNYCQWLFLILSHMENNHKSYTSEEQMPRIYGFIGELLLDVYVTKNQMNYCEYPIIAMGTESFAKKAFNFCKRKFLGIR